MMIHGIEQSDAVTAVSNSLVKQTKEKLGVKKDISVIYNFVNEQEYYKRNLNHIKKQYNIKSDEKVVIQDRKSTRLNSSHVAISYAVFCLKKKNMTLPTTS